MRKQALRYVSQKCFLGFISPTIFFLFLNNAIVKAAPPIDAGVLQRQIAPPSNNLPQLSPQSAKPLLQSEDGLSAAQESQSGAYVKRFRLAQPLAILSDEQLNILLTAFLNRKNTIDDLKKAADKVTAYLQDKGYFFARAYVLKQDVTDQVVAITVVLGKLSGKTSGHPEILIESKSGKRLRNSVIENIVTSSMKDPNGLRMSELERALLLINDLPRVFASGALIPGKELGSTALQLNLAEERSLFGFSAGVDNYGSRYTGSERVTAGVALNDPSGFGDMARLDLASSTGTKSIAGNYQIPLGGSGLTFNLGGNYLDYKVVTGLTELDSKGSSRSFNVGLNYPLLRSRTANFYLIAQLNDKKLTDKLLGDTTSDRNVQSMILGAQGNGRISERDGIVYSAMLTSGHINRDAVPQDLSADEKAANTQGNYTLLRGMANWAHQIGANWILSANYTLQIANKNLDSSEKFYLGGPRNIRAYSGEEAGGDQGQILNLEARWRVPYSSRAKELWTLIGFYDWGRVQRNRSTWAGWNAANPSMPNTYNLQGVGVGVQAQFGNRGSVELLLARKLASNPGATTMGLNADGLDKTYRFWLNAALQF